MCPIIGYMAAILTEQTAVLYGLATSSTKAQAHIAQFVAPLRRLVSVDSVVAVVGELARADGWDYAHPVLYADSTAQHVRHVIDELVYVQPSVQFALNSGNIMHQVQLLDARPVWGKRALPAPPAGDDFAQSWARIRLRQRHRSLIEHPAHPQVGHGGIEDWLTARTIMQLAGMAMPATLDLPQAIQLLYVSRNAGHTTGPTQLRPVRERLGELAADALDFLVVQHMPVTDVAAHLHHWLLDTKAAARLVAAVLA